MRVRICVCVYIYMWLNIVGNWLKRIWVVTPV